LSAKNVEETFLSAVEVISRLTYFLMFRLLNAYVLKNIMSVCIFLCSLFGDYWRLAAKLVQ
jgi:hypothetical protein